MKTPNQNKKNTHLKNADRNEIGFLLKKGYSHRAISQIIGKTHGAIDYEIEENSVNGIYDPKKAQYKAYSKRKHSKYQGMKVVQNDALRKYVKEKLAIDWSPEEISGRIKFLEKGIKYASAKAIYKYIYSIYGRLVEKYLRYKGKRKKGEGALKVTALKDRVFIQNRPKLIEKRRRFGDWEGDFIVSGKNGSGALLVLVERKTRYTIISKLTSRDTQTVNRTIYEMTGGMANFNSLTIDNDISFRRHKELSRMLKAPVYFCHPYHSWEKGTVENMNKWIRQYVPKGADISKLTDEQIRFIEERLNNRPRKCLKFRTPLEAMERNNQFKKEVCDMINISVNKKSHMANLRG